ncbi:Protein ERP1 [Lachnellula hyalina]|uniref:Protein ERP1 n=1 Tax=Lachnellula hyalina TaxID=1316788 RepID=A0A8H8TVZ8_9HELO|nr:Protein ERP1 [Lachnellula hyalina]TVY24339.1 Protein ERP1 [Lachnellula hyalina]
MRSILPLITLSALLAPVQSLFFYIDGTTPKCFFEELPKDTLVVGHYSAEEYDENMKAWVKHDGLSIAISVDASPNQEVFDNDHRVINQKGSSSGRFTFTAADSGDHKICFTPSSTSGGQGWLSALHPMGGIKLTLDLAIGETSAIESTDKGKIQDIVQKVKDLNGRLADIRREQVFQREREAEFRDQSESTNARVVRWTLVQLVVLGITCAWQLSHLRSFFIKQKLT